MSSMVNETIAEKPAASLTPPAAHIPLCDAKEDKVTPDSTFVVDINPHASEESDLSERHSDPSPSLSERPLSSPLPDVCSTNSSDVKRDVDVGNAPIEPPGLQMPSADPINCPAVEALPATETSPPPEVTSTNTAVSSQVHDALLDIEPSVFEHDLSRFSLDGVSPLDMFIPPDLFPEDILVHDLDNITKWCPLNERGLNVPKHKKPKTDVPVRYVRVYPDPYSPLMAIPDAEKEEGEDLGAHTSTSRDPPRRIAHLYLRHANSLGTGNHSCVYRAPLRLRLDPNSSVEGEDQDGGEVRGWRTVSVAAKTTDAVCGAHQMLHREARAYDTFPLEFMQDRVQLRSAPSHDPLLTRSKAVGDTSGVGLTPYEASLGAPLPYMHVNDEVVSESVQLPALVPKFFGYYCPADANGQRIGRFYHEWCNMDDTCPVKWPKRLLLVEECGKAVTPVTPRTLSREHREECFSLVKRLHKAGFTNGSMYMRNMVVQPGPLNVPRPERTMKQPSFRIIDFGRAVSRRWNGKDTFEESAKYDLNKAKSELLL